jgi:5-(carboxyamino)imidazole ribonucleotide synthase
MHNLLGDEVSGWQQLTAVSPALSLHLYGKTAAEPGRKMGHVTKITPLSE